MFATTRFEPDPTRTDTGADFIGSILIDFDENGDFTAERRYKPYGELLAGTATTYGWTGNTGSRATLLQYSEQYNRRRHYSTKLKQWSTRDPLWPSESAYSYVNGNPALYIDPNGTATCMIGAFKMTMICTFTKQSTRIVKHRKITKFREFDECRQKVCPCSDKVLCDLHHKVTGNVRGYGTASWAPINQHIEGNCGPLFNALIDFYNALFVNDIVHEIAKGFAKGQTGMSFPGWRIACKVSVDSWITVMKWGSECCKKYFDDNRPQCLDFGASILDFGRDVMMDAWRRTGGKPWLK